MAKVVAVVNTKGGVGKTTTSVNLADALFLEGYRVTLIDHDTGQSSADDWKRISVEAGHETFSVHKIDHDLARAIRELDEAYDVIVIDAPPRIEKTTASLVALADLVIIPVQPSKVDLWACKKTVDWIQEKQIISGGKPEARFLFCRINPSSTRLKEIQEDEDFLETGIPMLRTGTVQRQDYERAMAEGLTAMRLKPTNKARIEFTDIYREIKDVIGQH